MKPERLAEIRKVAERGDLTAPEHIRDGLRELLGLVDEMEGEYTADPPKPPVVPSIEEFHSLESGDVVACHDTEYIVDGWRVGTNGIRISKVRRDIGWSSMSATLIRPEDWLSGTWSLLRRAGEEAPA